MFWWGLYIMVLAFGIEYWYTIIGALIMQLLFLCYSIPVMEKHVLKKRPKYLCIILLDIIFNNKKLACSSLGLERVNE